MRTARGGRFDPVQQALKERNHEDFKQRLRERFGGEPKLLNSRICVRRLVPNGRCSLSYSRVRGSDHLCLPPGTDHPSLWAVNGQPVALVSEPYKWQWPNPEVPDAGRDELVAWAEARGLDVEISDRSWWNPSTTGYGGTVLVVFTAKGAPRSNFPEMNAREGIQVGEGV